MTDRQMMDDFMEFLEEHNYCKRINCDACQNWRGYYPEEQKGWCRIWKASTGPRNYCGYAKERIKDESISNG